MGLAALVFASIALVFALLPLVYTQLAGVVVGIVAVVLGVWGRKLARDQGQSRRAATVGAALGLAAAVLGAVLYGTFLYSAGRVGEELVRKIGGEMRRGDRASLEFRRAVEQAIRRARVAPDAPRPAAAQTPPAKRPASPPTGRTKK